MAEDNQAKGTPTSHLQWPHGPTLIPFPPATPSGIASELFAAAGKIKPVCSASSTVALSCAKHLNSTEGLISNKLPCHVNSLMADKRLSPCCTVADSRGDSITVSLPTLSFGTCGHSAAGTLHFRAHEQGLTSTRAPRFGCKSPPQGTCGPRGRWRRQSLGPGLLGKSLLPGHGREVQCRRICSLSSYQRYQLSTSEKTISSLAGRRLNKDELLGESSSKGVLWILCHLSQ